MVPRHPIEFTEALSLLQGMIGEDVEVAIKLSEHFFDCGFKGRLERVQTLPGDDDAVLVLLEGAQGVALDPAEVEAFIGSFPGQQARWVEFHVAQRVWVMLEPLTEFAPG